MWFVFVCESCPDTAKASGVANFHWWQFHRLDSSSSRRDNGHHGVTPSHRTANATSTPNVRSQTVSNSAHPHAPTPSLTTTTTTLRTPPRTLVPVTISARGVQTSTAVRGPILTTCGGSTSDDAATAPPTTTTSVVSVRACAPTAAATQVCPSTVFVLSDNEDGSWSLGATSVPTATASLHNKATMRRDAAPGGHLVKSRDSDHDRADQRDRRGPASDMQFVCVDKTTGDLQLGPLSVNASALCTRFRLQVSMCGWCHASFLSLCLSRSPVVDT